MFSHSFNTFMRHRRSIWSVAAAISVILLCLDVSVAQRAGETNSGMIGNEQIEGRVYFPKGDRADTRPIIRLQSLSSTEITAVTDQDGSFRFTHLKPDQYTIIVDGGGRYETARETVTITFGSAVPAQGDPGRYTIPTVYQIQIYLTPKHGTARDSAFTSLPASAQSLFQQAMASAHANQHQAAIEQLKSVITIAPGFARAYNELGQQYLKAGHGDQAVEAFKKGVEVDPADLGLRLNYGIALLNQKKFAAAEAELRKVTQADPASTSAAYYLGLALMGEQKIDEAQPIFEMVIKTGGDQYSLAHKYLGAIYWRNKQYREAADELEKYLKLDPKAADANKIRSTIQELRHKS